jgi:hypothetical protein
VAFAVLRWTTLHAHGGMSALRRPKRRTLETLLASLKGSRDIRSQVQSHGLGGV